MFTTASHCGLCNTNTVTKRNTINMDKHIVNDPRSLALESLYGLVLSTPSLSLDEQYRVITRSLPTPISDKVQLISGGGSGHEPSYAGMVGKGLLDAAVCGNVFASPNVGQIRRGIELVSKVDESEQEPKGVLMIIMR